MESHGTRVRPKAQTPGAGSLSHVKSASAAEQHRTPTQRTLGDFLPRSLSPKPIVSNQLSHGITPDPSPVLSSSRSHTTTLNRFSPVAHPTIGVPASATYSAGASQDRNVGTAPPVVPLVMPARTTRPTQLYRAASVPPPRAIPGLTPWTPGTQGIYPNFGCSVGQFPVWNVRITGMRIQDAMFAVSDQISPAAFYVAADVWSPDKKEWKMSKIYGAFSDAVHFARRVLFGERRAPISRLARSYMSV